MPETLQHLPIPIPIGQIIAEWTKESYQYAGLLKCQFRVRHIDDVDPEVLQECWGKNWRSFHPFVAYVLELRHIKTGEVEEIEDWQPRHVGNNYEQTLECVDRIWDVKAFCPVLQAYWDGIDQAREKARREEERKAELAEYDRRRMRQQRDSEAAFRRMASSKKFGHYAKQWNEFAQKNVDNTKLKTAIKETNYLLEAYNAVIDATTIPVKAMAIKKFFKLLSFQYRDLIPKIKKD